MQTLSRLAVHPGRLVRAGPTVPLAGFLLLVATLGAGGATAASDPTPARVVRVGAYSNGPLVFRDVAGKVEGLFPDLPAAADRRVAVDRAGVCLRLEGLMSRWIGRWTERGRAEWLPWLLWGAVFLALTTGGALLVAFTFRRRLAVRTTELARMNSLLRMILDTIPVCVFWEDREARLMGCNRAYAERLGLDDPKAAIGKPAADLGLNEDLEKRRRDDLEVMEKRQAVFREEELQDLPDGRRRIVRTSKAPLTDGSGRVIGLVGAFEDVTEKRRNELERLRLMAAIEHAAEVIMVTDAHGTIEYVNPAFSEVTGYQPHEAVGRNPRFLKSDKQDDVFYTNLWQTITSGKVWRGRLVNRRKDARLYHTAATISPVFDESGTILNFVAVERDVTREVDLEQQIHESQRLEVVGQLAGGMAHDFRNILQAQMGLLEFAREDAGAETQAVRDIDEALACARRAADLTHKLLAFSRRQILKIETLDVNAVLADFIQMVRRLIPEDIKVQLVPGRVGTVNADRVQLEQVLLNLALNARDAMPEGGILSLKTETVHLDEEYRKAHPWAVPGRYVLISVADTGFGMEEDTLARVFEPFFTTKAVGRGTGLGLAMVYGIVRQHDGMVRVHSEPGKGATFNVYLPEAEQRAAEGNADRPGPAPGGSEGILVVEDDAGVRRALQGMLRRAGYRLFVASNGAEACELIESHRDEIAMAIVDVVMPGMGGREVYRRLKHAKPELRVLFSTGYSEGAIHTRFILDEGLELFQKPYDGQALLRKVRSMLDESRSTHRGPPTAPLQHSGE
ncbi:MAG: PAS domain S-box protein [Kiritimatiellaeota bacterium]|nr:PAS domain S-box protein [Kiritimatiellota bacterium]